MHSHADFRQRYADRKAGTEIGPYLSRSCERDIKQSTRAGALPCGRGALSAAQTPGVAAGAVEQSPLLAAWLFLVSFAESKAHRFAWVFEHILVVTLIRAVISYC